MEGHRERLGALVAPIPTAFATLVLASMLVALRNPIRHSHASWLPMSPLCSHRHCSRHWIMPAASASGGVAAALAELALLCHVENAKRSILAWLPSPSECNSR